MMFFSGSHKPVKAAPEPSLQRLPEHIAIIMDGNGRWARARGLPRTAGHKKGADALRNTLNACRDAGVKYLTIYAFSSENWKRSSEEVGDLMQLLKHYLEHELQALHESQVRMRFIGDLSLLDDDIRSRIEHAVETTSRNRDFNLTIALSYGSRQELARAVKKLVASVQSGELAIEDISENTIAQALDTAGLPEPDLLIRTGGEQRLSNFLLWQSAYTEFYFTETLWPDFNAKHFNAAIEDYAQRERRYGTAK